MIDLAKATRYIAVASFSQLTRDEWKAARPDYVLPPDEWKDYALLKVLDHLRLTQKNKTLPIHTFKHEEDGDGLDFSTLAGTDVTHFGWRALVGWEIGPVTVGAGATQIVGADHIPGIEGWLTVRPFPTD